MSRSAGCADERDQRIAPILPAVPPCGPTRRSSQAGRPLRPGSTTARSKRTARLRGGDRVVNAVEDAPGEALCERAGRELGSQASERVRDDEGDIACPKRVVELGEDMHAREVEVVDPHRLNDESVDGR